MCVIHVDTSELLSSVLAHQLFDVYPQFLCIFAVCKTHQNHHHIPNRNLDVLHMQLLPHCKELCVHPCLFRTVTGLRHFRRSLENAKFHHQECTHHWLFCGMFRLLQHLDKSSTVSTAAPVSKSIFTHSNRFGLLTAPRSKLPREVILRSS